MRNPIRSAKDAVKRHKIRRTHSGFEYVMADRIAFLDAKAWDGLTDPHSIFMSRRYLSALESDGPENIAGRYAMVYDDGQPMCAIAAQRVEINLGQIEMKSKSKRSRALRAMASPFRSMSQHMLVCGNLLSWGNHGLAVSPEAPESIAAGVAEALYRIRRADKLLGDSDFVMVKDITSHAKSLAEGLRTWSYRRCETEPNMVLALRPEWKTFDDYLASLTSPYRKAAKKIHKDVDAAGIELMPICPDERMAGKLHAAYMQVHDAAAVRLFTLRESFWPALARSLGDDFICTAAIKNGEIIGFITSVRDGATAVGYYIGFDRAVNAEAPLYFRLLHAAIGQAIEWGCERLSFGRTALEPKARLGAKPEAMAVYIRHRIPLLNQVVKAVVKNVHHDEAPQREPFRE